MNELIEKMVIAPYFTPKYMLIENGIQLIQNSLICIIYIKLWIEGSLPYENAIFSSIWLFLLFALNSALAIFHVLFIPQLITLPTLKQKKQQVNQLRVLLRCRIYYYIYSFSLIVFVLYIFGVLLFVIDLLFGQTYEDTYTLKTFIRYSILLNIIKHFALTIPLRNYFDRHIVLELQKDFIYIFNYKIDNVHFNSQETCSICQAQYKQGDILAEYLCDGRHIYHRDCIQHWLRMQNNRQKVCPYCKQLPKDYNQ